MSSWIPEGLGLREPRAPRGPRPERRAAPPFRRRHASREPEKPPARAARGFSGLSRGGTMEALIGRSRRERATGAGVSAALHLLLLVVLLGGFVPTAAEDRELIPSPEMEDPLLYAFEAPPLEPDAEGAATEETPPGPLEFPEPEEETEQVEAPAPPAVPIQIPEAQIAVPNTGFQNDLPFSEGEDEEFYVDREAGEAGEADDAETATGAEGEPDPEPAADRFDPTASEAPEPEPAEPPSSAGRPPLLFDEEAFRERINDPAADVRRQSDAMAWTKARALAEAERRRQGQPTDIWRFLEGKRFRNPEGGLVSNRNNTLYYDDRGANLVPWISRLIAEVRRNWYIPYAASYERGHVAIAISVLRSGEIAWLQVVVPSGVPGFDNAAVGALRGARLLPLPDDYPGRDFEIMLVFWYNETPYDLFSR